MVSLNVLSRHYFEGRGKSQEISVRMADNPPEVRTG